MGWPLRLGPVKAAKSGLTPSDLPNTRGIHAVYEAALAAKDYPAQVLMHWFINEQVEEEKWANDLVTLVRNSSCAGSLASLDRHVSSLLGADKSGD